MNRFQKLCFKLSPFRTAAFKIALRLEEERDPRFDSRFTELTYRLGRGFVMKVKTNLLMNCLTENERLFLSYKTLSDGAPLVTIWDTTYAYIEEECKWIMVEKQDAYTANLII